MINLTPFAMKGILGLCPHSIGVILAYMNSTGCTAGGLSALIRTIKRDRTCELVCLHPENPILHESGRMLQHCNAVWFCKYLLFLPKCDALGHYEEFEHVKCPLRDSLVPTKLILGK